MKFLHLILKRYPKAKFCKKGRQFLICSLIISIAPLVAAFDTNGSKWSAGEATFHVAPQSTSGSGLSSAQLQSAFILALDKWTNSTNFTYKATNGSADPCATPPSFTNPANNNNGYSFASNYCGSSFGSSTLAVAINWTNGNSIIQSGIVYNASKNWNIYTGPQSTNSGFDFTRVTVHEAGHSLGLGHELVNSAIMKPNISDIEDPQPDDLNGVAFLYGLAANPSPFSLLPAILFLLDAD